MMYGRHSLEIASVAQPTIALSIGDSVRAAAGAVHVLSVFGEGFRDVSLWGAATAVQRGA